MNKVSITITVTILAALFGTGCSINHQPANAPVAGVTPVAAVLNNQASTAQQAEAIPAAMQVVNVDAEKESSAATVSPAPQPTPADAEASQPTAPVAGAADARPYADVRKQCTFAVTNNRSEFFYARDASMKSAWQSYPGDQSITVDVPSDVKDITGFYFKWDSPPPTWNLYAYDLDGKEILAGSGGENCGRTEFAEVPASMSAYKKFRFVSTNPDIAFALTNISVYADAIPDFAPRWEALRDNRVDLLVVAAHPDDESVFLAAPAITYMNEGKTAVTGYMTWGTAERRFEAEEACWMLGEKYAPTMRAAHDMMTNSLESMERYWSLDKAVEYVVELIRKYKPSVVVTHDVGGEYGHGAHMETSLATQLAFAQASDPTKFPESAEKYGVWMPGKLYLHMYGEDKITFNLNAPLDNYSGKTVLQVATAAFQRHSSQAAKGWTVESTGRCSMEYFGLFASNVGPDVDHDSMFENITPDIMNGINGVSLNASARH